VVYVVDMKEPIIGQRLELVQLGIEPRQVEINCPVRVGDFDIPNKNLRELANGLKQTKVYWILHT
jgi:hypothetical protein